MTMSRPRNLLSILPLALGLAGCVSDNADSGLIVLKAVPAEAGCTFSAGGDTFLSSGIIQSDARNGYLVAPELRNDIVLADGELATPKTVFITGADVEINFPDETLFAAAEQTELRSSGLARFRLPLSGLVEPSGGTAVVPMTVVPPELLARIDAKLASAMVERTVVVIDIQVLGTRGGGGVSSNVFHFPVEICADCLVTTLGHCIDVTPTQPVHTGGVCQVLQDGQLDCCIDDHDDLEVVCDMAHPEPPAGRVCKDLIDDPEMTVCPARTLEL